MSVYTCFDMLTDWPSGKPAAYRYLAVTFVPAFRWLMARYGGGDAEVRRLLERLKKPVEIAPMAERPFLARLRPVVLEAAGWSGGRAGTLDLATFSEALAELTAFERQVVWFEAMGYGVADAARLCRSSEETAAGARDRAAEMLRVKIDAWDRGMVRANGELLAEEARAAPPAEAIRERDYLDIVDGRLSWQGRTAAQRAMGASWFEVDHLCRLREADAAVRETKPLEGEEADEWLAVFGLKREEPPFWRRVLLGTGKR